MIDWSKFVSAFDPVGEPLPDPFPMPDVNEDAELAARAESNYNRAQSQCAVILNWHGVSKESLWRHVLQETNYNMDLAPDYFRARRAMWVKKWAAWNGKIPRGAVATVFQLSDWGGDIAASIAKKLASEP